MERIQEYFPPERAAQPHQLHHGIQQALTNLDSQSRFLRLHDVAERLKHRRIALGRGRCGAPVARKPWVLGCILRACDREGCEKRCVVPVGAEVVEGYLRFVMGILLRFVLMVVGLI
jgi:hypothetical protein